MQSEKNSRQRKALHINGGLLTVDNFVENDFACGFFYLKNISADFRNPLPFRRLSAKPHQSKRLRGLG
ncbi:hypothetical protein AM233_20700 [Bacillus sp. FJAT-22058]|nr:hypothetical protein AM233_20700 [Bacillus sp. FJAT-22058]